MPLHSLKESELRDHCKRAIEGLELWLRRLIHDKLSAAYGGNYLDAARPDGTRVIRSELARTLTERQKNEPKRYSRPIDAALLEDEISIICNPALYKPHFEDALVAAFPLGNDSARVTLERLVGPRNALYHANPVSIHDAYRVLCYTLDVVESLKAYYVKQNMAQQYNVPTVIRVTDSLGHVVSMSTANRHPVGVGSIDYSNDSSAYLHCGDTLTIDVEVDPAFDPKEYAIEWGIANIGGPALYGPKFQMELTERYVSSRFTVVCRVTSKKGWHKLGTHDDQIDMAYRVLPPP